MKKIKYKGKVCLSVERERKGGGKKKEKETSSEEEMVLVGS